MNDFLSLVNQIVPEEPEAPKALFDCEPSLKSRDGKMRHDWGAHIRKQFKQDDLNLKWEERQRVRAEFLKIINPPHGN